MSLMDKVLDALRPAVLLESRVGSLGNAVGELAKDVRNIDRRLVRVETVIELGTKGGFSGSGRPAIEG
jgi:hypothetical protein